jgi:hypothetical protein
MTMKIRMLACAALLPLILPAWAVEVPPAQLSAAEQAAEKDAAANHQLPPGWPRDGAKKLIENDRGIAWNVTYYKDKPSQLHEHPYFFAGLDLNTASVVTRKPGETNWTQPGVVKRDNMWFLPKGLTHAEMTVTDPGRHTVVIDIKDKRVPEAANTTSYPVGKFAPSQTKVVDNDMVTIWDAAWGPRDGVMSFDSRDMFLAIAEGGDLSIQEDGQPAQIKHVESGEALFLPGGKARAISSGPGTTVRAMLVEMK